MRASRRMRRWISVGPARRSAELSEAGEAIVLVQSI